MFQEQERVATLVERGDEPVEALSPLMLHCAIGLRKQDLGGSGRVAGTKRAEPDLD
jgi:hypothetical protein